MTYGKAITFERVANSPIKRVLLFNFKEN